MKLLTLLAACFFSFQLFAQNDIQDQMDTIKNCLTLRNGRVVIKQNGKAIILKQDTILANGIKITPNGDIIRKDGSHTLMQTGQCFSMEGSQITGEPAKSRKVAVKK